MSLKNLGPRRRSARLAVSAAVVLLGIVSGIPLAQLAAGAQSVPSRRPDYEEEIAATLPGPKQTVVAEQVEARATAAALPRAPKDPAKAPTFAPVPTPGPLPYGRIVNESQAPLPRQYRVNNQWADFINGELVAVYVGYLAADPPQGVVIVSSKTFGGIYRTPTRDGGVKLTDVRGLVFTLQDLQGATILFDLATRQFRNP